MSNAFRQTSSGSLGNNAPALHPDAAAALRRHRAGTPEQRELLGRTAVFLARIEDSPCVTTAHVEAAAAIADGNDLSHVADTLAAQEDLSDFGVPAMPQPVRAALPVAVMRGKPPIARSFRRVVGRHRLGVAVAGLALVGAAAWLLAHGSTPPGPPVTQTALAAPLAQPPSASLAPAVPAPAAPPPVAPGPATPLAEQAVGDAPPELSPDAAMLHVTVAYPPNDPDARKIATRLVQLLQADGYDVAEPEPGTTHPRTASLGIFFTKDRAAAHDLLGRISDVLGPEPVRERLLRVRGATRRPGSVRIILPTTRSG